MRATVSVPDGQTRFLRGLVEPLAREDAEGPREVALRVTARIIVRGTNTAPANH